MIYQHNDAFVPSWYELNNSGTSLNISSLLLKGDEVFQFSNKTNLNTFWATEESRGKSQIQQ
jgi:hypothetical protein